MISLLFRWYQFVSETDRHSLQENKEYSQQKLETISRNSHNWTLGRPTEPCKNSLFLSVGVLVLPVQMKCSDLCVVSLKVREVEEVWGCFLFSGLSRGQSRKNNIDVSFHLIISECNTKVLLTVFILTFQHFKE